MGVDEDESFFFAVGYAMSFAKPLYARQFRGILARRNGLMRIIIMGCGRLGAYLARHLDSEGHDVTVVDRSSDSFARLGSEFHARWSWAPALTKT